MAGSNSMKAVHPQGHTVIRFIWGSINIIANVAMSKAWAMEMSRHCKNVLSKFAWKYSTFITKYSRNCTAYNKVSFPRLLQLLHHLTEHSEVGGHLQGKFPHGKAPGQHLPPLQTAGQRMACHLITGKPVQFISFWKSSMLLERQGYLRFLRLLIIRGSSW